MISRGVYYLVIALLLITGISLMCYQHITYSVPWLPGKKNVAWDIEAKITFQANKENLPVKVSFAIPTQQPGYKVVNETSASPDYGLIYKDVNGQQRAEWSKRLASGNQTLYYRVEVLADEAFNNTLMTVPEVSEILEPEPYYTAMVQIKDAAYSRSVDPFSLTHEIFQELNNQDQNAKLLLNKYKKADLIVKILNLANIPAQQVTAIKLEDGRRNQKLLTYIAVFNENNEYHIFDPTSETIGLGKDVFIWNNNNSSTIDVTGGENASVNFSIVRNFISDQKAFDLKHNVTNSQGKEYFDLSVNTLPIEERAVFKSVLLIPIGVLIVVFLRIIVGLKTSGTFMPVLIAMSFLQTNLSVGLIGFLAIVGIGLIIRSWLSHLNLLLVARISTVIIAVIGIIGILSFLTYKIGISDCIKITFFPMIILSWTIERMSILWEEEGPREVMKQGSGSLLVAVLAYLAMNNTIIQHITFNFLGLQLIILAAVLLMGNYTGYRLSELKRFKPLAEQINSPTGQKLEADRLKQEIKELKKDL